MDSMRFKICTALSIFMNLKYQEEECHVRCVISSYAISLCFTIPIYSGQDYIHIHVRCSFSFGYLPESLATILAICARSLLSSSCRAVVRFSAVTPGFLSPSILLPSRRKLGTDEFLWSTRRGVGRHSCFRGRASLLKTEERVINY